MTARARPRRWREVKRRPVQGNSPNDRMLRGPDCKRPKRVYADSFPATPSPQFPRTQKIPEKRFVRHAESIGPMWSLNHLDLRPECRLPLVGPRAPVKERDGRSAFCSSSAMSSDRLFLDRVARQHCPSPLHRHGQTNTHPLPASPKQDISTLRRIGHFYFALTLSSTARQWDSEYETSNLRVLRIRALPESGAFSLVERRPRGRSLGLPSLFEDC
jgi:hypothetical protein